MRGRGRGYLLKGSGVLIILIGLFFIWNSNSYKGKGKSKIWNRLMTNLRRQNHGVAGRLK
jgi:hypothetical protein